MSDAERYTHSSHQELLDADSLFREILEKAQALLADSGTVLHWQSLDTPVMTLADREQLERSLLNLLSNAVKFSPEGTPITVNLTRNGQMLYLRLQTGGHMSGNSGKGPGTAGRQRHRAALAIPGYAGDDPGRPGTAGAVSAEPAIQCCEVLPEGNAHHGQPHPQRANALSAPANRRTHGHSCCTGNPWIRR